MKFHKKLVKHIKPCLKTISAIIILLSFYFSMLIAQSPKTFIETKSPGNFGFKKLSDFNDPVSGSRVMDLQIEGNWLYGVCYAGGLHNKGTLFKVKTDGSVTDKFDFWINGTNPTSLGLSDYELFGTTRYGGSYGIGNIYRVKSDFTGNISEIYQFPYFLDYPMYEIIISGTKIYGLAYSTLGGYGYIFKINTDGTEFIKLMNFDLTFSPHLILSDNYLYVTRWGNAYDAGEVFRLKTDGTDYLSLHRFESNSETDGKHPGNPLTILGNAFYGTTESGGTNNGGTFFRISTDLNNYTRLYDFKIEDTTSDKLKITPGTLVTDGYTFYGISHYGGIRKTGAIFRINKDGTGFENLYYFTDSINGLYPSKIVMSGDTLFGYTDYGGKYGYGVLFRYNLDPSQTYKSGQIRSFKLSIKSSERVSISAKKNLVVEAGKFIDLDTAFSITGNTQYTHSWKVKTNYGYDMINRIAKISSDSTFYLFVTTIQGCSFLDSVMVHATISTSIHDPNIENQIIIYPNPSSGNFKIKVSEGHARYSYDIINVSGINIENGNIDCPTEECFFNIKRTNILPGVYTIIIKKNDSIYSQKKFIISK